MKKVSFNLLMLLTFGAAFMMLSSCGDDGDDEEPIPEPVAGFTVSDSNPLAGEEVSFTNTTTDASTYQWSFGDGGTSSEQNPTHTYESEGTYTVTLTVTGEGGNDSHEEQITVGFPNLIFANAVDDAGSFNYKLFSVVFGTSNTANQIGNYPDDSDRHIPVAVSNDGSKIYYLDNFNGVLFQANIDGSGETEIVTGAFFYPSGIALDVGGNVYVTDRGDSDSGEGAAVFKVTPTGTVTTVYSDADGLEVPTAIVIDQATGDMYINDVGATNSGYAADGIWKGNVDGSAISKEITGGGYSIALSPEEGKLYYNDAFVDGNLKMADLDDLANPSKFADLDEANSYGLYYFNGRVYWTDLGANVDGGEGKLMRASSTGANAVAVLSDLLDPRGLVVFK